jgi:lysophospholipase L1-like esterase
VDPGPFLRGVGFPGTDRVPYPRARADDAARLPLDTWISAQIPVGVRVELVGDAEKIEIDYQTRTEELGYRGDGAGRTFTLWRGGEKVDEAKATVGKGTARLTMGDWPPELRAVVYLPEGMRPTVTGVKPLTGAIGPAPPQPRWVAYGDSVLEGWMASEPCQGWAAIVSRDHELDLVNMGYAGAARGEIASAEHVADLEADVISITHGTNCWTRTPHSVPLFREGLNAFLDIVRQRHRRTPVVVSSPVLRPDGENNPNRLDATLGDLREAMEAVVRDRIADGDSALSLVPGGDLIDKSQLADGIHPNDDGHQAIATALGPAVRRALDGGGP